MNSSKFELIFNAQLPFIDIIHGKLDERKGHLEVDYAIGRDIRPNDIGNISATLKEWCDSCETVLNCIEEQIDRANKHKFDRLKHKEEMEQEVSRIFCFLFGWSLNVLFCYRL